MSVDRVLVFREHVSLLSLSWKLPEERTRGSLSSTLRGLKFIFEIKPSEILTLL